MSAMARCTPARIGKLLACLLLQVAFLFAASPASASLGPPCHHHSHGTHATAEPVPGQHDEADHHPSSPASDHCGHCLTCCLGGVCTAAWVSPSGSIGVVAFLFRTVRFTPEPTWWLVGQSALPALPPPRRIA